VFRTASLVSGIECRHYLQSQVRVTEALPLRNIDNSDLLKTEIAYNTWIFTAVTRNHGSGQKSRYTVKITVITATMNSWFSYSPSHNTLEPYNLLNNWLWIVRLWQLLKCFVYCTVVSNFQQSITKTYPISSDKAFEPKLTRREIEIYQYVCSHMPLKTFTGIYRRFCVTRFEKLTIDQESTVFDVNGCRQK